MKGIARLGALKGISQTYTAFKQQEMKDKAEADRLQAKADADAKAAKLAHERAIELKELENQHDKLMKGRELYYDTVNAEREAMQATAELELETEKLRRDEEQAKADREHELEVARVEQILRDRSENKKYERAVIQTFGVKEEIDQGDGSIYTRLPTSAEMVAAIKQSVDNNTPMLIPKELGSLVGLKEALKNRARTSGTASGGIDYDDYLFSWTDKNGKVQTVYGVGQGGDSSDRAIRGMSAIYEQIGVEGFKTIKENFDKGETDDFYRLRTHINNYGKEAYIEALGGKKTAEGGDRYISDPLTATLHDQIDDDTTRRWYLKHLVSPTTGLALKTLQRFAGIPEQFKTRDEIREGLIIPQRESYEWALDPDSEIPKIRDDLWLSASKVSKYSGVSPEAVIKTFGEFDNPELAFKNAEKDRNILNNILEQRLDGKYRIRPSEAVRLENSLRDKGLETVEEQVNYVRQNLAKTSAYKPSKILITGTGEERVVGENLESGYGLSQEDAAAQAESARQVVELATKIQLLQDAGLGSPGFEGITIRALGGLKQIGTSLLKMINTYDLDPNSNAARQLADSSKRLEGIMSLPIDKQIEGQALYDLLAEQLAFAMAAAFQKGEGGRAISDRDVEAMRSVLGLRKLTANDAGARRNLVYLKEDFGKIAAIQGEYARAGDSLMFKAAFIVDKANTRMRSVTELVDGVGRGTRYNRFGQEPTNDTAANYSSTDVGTYEISPGVTVTSGLAR